MVPYHTIGTILECSPTYTNIFVRYLQDNYVTFFRGAVGVAKSIARANVAIGTEFDIAAPFEYGNFAESVVQLSSEVVSCERQGDCRKQLDKPMAGK
jgi:hypothetical protein